LAVVVSCGGIVRNTPRNRNMAGRTFHSVAAGCFSRNHVLSQDYNFQLAAHASSWW